MAKSDGMKNLIIRSKSLNMSELQFSQTTSTAPATVLAVDYYAQTEVFCCVWHQLILLFGRDPEATPTTYALCH